MHVLCEGKTTRQKSCRMYICICIYPMHLLLSILSFILKFSAFDPNTYLFVISYYYNLTSFISYLTYLLAFWTIDPKITIFFRILQCAISLYLIQWKYALSYHFH